MKKSSKKWMISGSIAFFICAQASAVVDFNFDQLRNCEGQFSYEKVFLLDGRSPTEHLVRDPEATRFIETIIFGTRLKPVTEAYSMELSKNYIWYESFKPIAKRMALILVEAQPDSRLPGSGLEEFPYDLLLVVTEGPNRGQVFSAHQANFDADQGTIHSVRFTCKANAK